MKNIFKIFFVLVVAFTSCKKEEMIMPVASSDSGTNRIEKQKATQADSVSIKISTPHTDESYVNAPKGGGMVG